MNLWWLLGGSNPPAARTQALYPAPRWFREVVQAWLEETPPEKRRERMSDLFTRICDAQPPDLREVNPKDCG